MNAKRQSKKESTITVSNSVNQVRRKAVSVPANESSVAAELKNREHGNEKPAR